MNQTTLPSRKAKAWLRRILTALAVSLGGLLAYDSYKIFYDANFRTVVSGEAYRSGQMDAAQLSRVIEEYGIKSIVNLRGTDAPALYRGEIETAQRLGVQHYDFRFQQRMRSRCLKWRTLSERCASHPSRC